MKYSAITRPHSIDLHDDRFGPPKTVLLTLPTCYKNPANAESKVFINKYNTVSLPPKNSKKQ